MTTSKPPKQILSAAALARRRAGWKRQGKRVVFTNGVFDVLHRGHLVILEKARSAGDILIVGLNSDRSVRRLKGAGRPINRQRDRAIMLAALRPVDFVCIFGADTPLWLIKTLRPDVLIKGAEYQRGDIVGAREVRSWGGRVVRVRMRPNYSTTRIVAHRAG